jgi:hypothetical protein
LPADWHDDGECPTYRQASAYLFTPEPMDLREFCSKPITQYRIAEIGKGYAIIQTWVDHNGVKQNDLADVARTREELEPRLAEYQQVAAMM